MGGESTAFGVFHTPENLLWEQWWSIVQPALLGSSEDRSSMATGLYGQNGTLLDDFVYRCDTNSTDQWNDPSLVTEYTAPSSASDYMISDASPAIPEYQVQVQPPADEKPDRKRKREHPARKTKRRNSSRDDGTIPQEEDSNIGPKATRGGNPTQQRIQERNRIASNKFRVKKGEDVLRLKSNEQDMERIHRDLSTCVSDLLLEVYELKMQLLQHTECNCALIQNYLVHEAQRYIQALVEQSQQEAPISNSTLYDASSNNDRDDEIKMALELGG